MSFNKKDSAAEKESATEHFSSFKYLVLSLNKNVVVQTGVESV